MGFTKLGLSAKILQGVEEAGYSTPTAIQLQAIPAAIAGKDIIGCSQTGTGKTAAFVLPILHRLSTQPSSATQRVPRALVLTPTRELCVQVNESVRKYGKFLSIHTMAVYGGSNISSQIKHLQHGVDVLVATPGRLIDLMNRRVADLSHVEVLVIDEADRMFDMGFIADVRKIIARVQPKRQSFLFSATMSKEVLQLVRDVQKDPQLIEVGERNNPVESVTQHFYSCPSPSKLRLLQHVLEAEKMHCVLVFSRTKHGADKIAKQLIRKGVACTVLHSNRTQSQRQRALAEFKSGVIRVLVATDIAARGIDVDGISHVINFDTPRFAEDYVHRIGRTGRASATGDALTFVSNDEREFIQKIGRFIGRRSDPKPYHGFDYSMSANDRTQDSSDESRHGEGKSRAYHTERKSRPYHADGISSSHYAEGRPRSERRDGKSSSHPAEGRARFERTEGKSPSYHAEAKPRSERGSENPFAAKKKPGMGLFSKFRKKRRDDKKKY